LSDQYIRELDLAIKARDYVRGNLALTSEALRVLVFDMAEALEVSGRQGLRDNRPGKKP
jgi:hypothetical protein